MDLQQLHAIVRLVLGYVNDMGSLWIVQDALGVRVRSFVWTLRNLCKFDREGISIVYGGPPHETFAQVGKKRYPPGDNKSTNSTGLGNLRGTAVKLLECVSVDRTQLLENHQ